MLLLTVYWEADLALFRRPDLEKGKNKEEIWQCPLLLRKIPTIRGGLGVGIVTMKCATQRLTWNVQSRLHEVLLFNQFFNLCLMTKGRWYAKENNEKSLVRDRYYLCRGEGEGKICWKDQNFCKPYPPPADHVNSKWQFPSLFNTEHLYFLNFEQVAVLTGWNYKRFFCLGF